MKSPDMSVIMTFHEEGRLAEPTIQAVKAAIEYARDKGLDVEVIFILDRPDMETEAFCKNHLRDSTRLFNVDFGSVALARNFASEKAEAPFLAHLDSDDLCSENWFHASYMLAAKEPRPSIFHPETIIHFEGRKLLVKAIESEDLEFLKERMWPGTLWNGYSCASREIYLQYKFPHIEFESGFGYEDWHWVCTTLSAGVKHMVVPDTLYCYRAKTWKNSLCTDQDNLNLVLGRTPLYNLAFQKGS